MQADDIYRFLALRPVTPVSPSEVKDPFIEAYSYRTQPAAGSFRAAVTAALAAGDVAAARAESAQLLMDLNVATAWNLLDGTFYRNLFLALPDLVRRGIAGDVEKAMVKAFDVAAFDAIAARSQAIADQRARVADYLTACSLTGVAEAALSSAGLPQA